MGEVQLIMDERRRNAADGLSPTPRAASPVASPNGASNPVISTPTYEDTAIVEEIANISDPKQTPNTQFWEEASRIAEELEQSAGKSSNREDPSSSTHAHTESEAIIAIARPRRPGDDLICPTFDLLPNGETWTQHLAANNHPSPQSVANISSSSGPTPNKKIGTSKPDKHPTSVAKASGVTLTNNLPTISKSPTPDGGLSASLLATAKQSKTIQDDGPYSETARPRRPGDDIICPTFDLLPNGATWTQHLAANNPPPPQSVANISSLVGKTPNKTAGTSHPDKHPTSVANASGIELANNLPSTCKSPTLEGGLSASLLATDKQSTTILDGGPYLETAACTVGTRTQDKKNRKKRAFLGINNEANKKKLKKLKVTDESKEVYDTYILRRCIKPPKIGEKERPHFVDYGDYHISYEHFREALKPRGRIGNQVMELFIRHFNLVTNIPTTSEPMCTKFAFSQSLIDKLMVHEEKFNPKCCVKEFMAAYNDHKLNSKDTLYFAVVDNEHSVLVSINLLYKQVNVLDSMRSTKKTKVYDKAHFLVNNFITLASYAQAFPRTNFNEFVQNNPQELRQQTTLFDCGIFVMLFMKLWDGKIVKPFGPEMIDHRMVITHMLMTSELNKADPTWVLKKK